MIIVKYQIEGYDHDGYCSGNDVLFNDSPDKWINYNLFSDKEKIRNWKKDCTETTFTLDISNDFTDNVFNKDINVFYDYNNGCTSGGSGYCSGFEQEWLPLSVTILTPENKDSFIEELKKILYESNLTRNEKDIVSDNIRKIRYFFMSEVEKLKHQINSLKHQNDLLTIKNSSLTEELDSIKKILKKIHY